LFYLAQRPTDYTLNHYAGINQKLRADRLPETAAPEKEALWAGHSHGPQSHSRAPLRVLYAGSQ
jgi:hypothetical protein